MKRKALERAAVGAFAGIAIGQIICVLISLINNTGEFAVCAPDFVKLIGNEAAAAAGQTVLCGIMGSGFAAASVIWEMDELSLAAQSGICFGIYALLMFPIAYFTGWMEHSAAGILSYIGIFTGTFIIVWAVQYFAWKNRIKKLNEAVDMKY